MNAQMTYEVLGSLIGSVATVAVLLMVNYYLLGWSRDFPRKAKVVMLVAILVMMGTDFLTPWKQEIISLSTGAHLTIDAILLVWTLMTHAAPSGGPAKVAYPEYPDP